MLSNLQRFRIVDEKGTTAKPLDFAVDVLAEDHPPITRLFYKLAAGEIRVLPWSRVRQVNTKRRTLLIEDLTAGNTISEAEFAVEVCLLRDVQDALILDLQNRRSTRANDLWLENQNGRLVLRGADTSINAILRRLTGNLWRGVNRRGLYDWRYVEFLRGDPQAVRNGAGYHLRITRLAPGEIAGFIEAIPYLHAAELLILLPDDLAARVLEVIDGDKQQQIFEELDEMQSFAILTRLSPETAVRIIKRLSAGDARRQLNRLPKQQREAVVELLRYPEGTVGSIMTNNVVSITVHETIGTAREELCENLKNTHFVHFVYVVEDEINRRLCGVISLRHLLTEPPEKSLEQAMDAFVSTLHPLEPAHEAAFRVIDSHLAAMPVIDQERRLVGAVTIDAAVSTVAPANWRNQAPRVFS